MPDINAAIEAAMPGIAQLIIDFWSKKDEHSKRAAFYDVKVSGTTVKISYIESSWRGQTRKPFYAILPQDAIRKRLLAALETVDWSDM